MKEADDYRSLAAAELERAEAETLPNAKARALHAAAKWTQLAERKELGVAGRRRATETAGVAEQEQT